MTVYVLRLVPSIGNSWHCIIKVSGTLYDGLKKRDKDLGSVYEVLRELGILKIREAIETAEPFSEFMFADYDFRTDEEKHSLITKLRELKEKKPLT